MQYTINYRLTIDNGELVDEAQNFEFTAGDGQLTPELENCITQSKTCELQTILLNGAAVFGDYDENAIREMQKDEMPQDFKIADAIDFDLPNGEKVIGVVQKILENSVVIDFNHPLSRCNIAFNFEIISKV